MELPGESSSPKPGPMNGAEPEESGPGRALTMHLLRMLETRMDAAGIALQSEMETLGTRLQLKLLAAGALFLAIWGGIVLLAIALPAHLRIPVLSAVVAVFVIGAVWAQLAAQRKVAPTDVGSLRWFLDGLRLDLEVLSRSLARSKGQPAAHPPASTESTQ
jgi:uncharacterized membrane protein YqjE